ncbi:MAG: hypothetical protein IPL15_10715 [Comamonadaceae bacterium]|nr:hypothetical protein [Comamonadaceae bacterium]
METIEVVEDDSFMSVSAKQVEDGIWKRLKSVCDARWNMKETFGFGLPRYLVAQGSVLIKITIPSAVRSDFMGYLDDMNINEQSLFPGLDGYARHMKRLIARWSVNNKWGAHYRQLK